MLSSLIFSSIVTILSRPIVEVLPEFETKGYQVTSDECVIFGFRHIDVKKGVITAEIACVYDNEEF